MLKTKVRAENNVVFATGDPKDKDYNSIDINFVPVCTCGGDIKPTDNEDSSLFFGAEDLIVIPTTCTNCGNFGCIHLDIRSQNLGLKDLI